MSIKKKIWGFVYKQRALHNGFISNRLYKLLLRFGDPIISYSINGYKCDIPFSYSGCFFMKAFPYYDRQLSRICTFIKKKKGRLSEN